MQPTSKPYELPHLEACGVNRVVECRVCQHLRRAHATLQCSQRLTSGPGSSMQASSMQHSHGCNANVDAVPQQEHTQQRWRWGSGQQQPVSSRSPYSAQPAPHGPPCLSAARLPGRRRRQAWPQARPTACRPPAKANSQRSTGMSSDQAAQYGSEQWRARAVREAGSLRGWGCAIWGANSRAQVPAVAWEAHGEAPPSGSSTVGACGRRSRHHCKDVNCPAHLCLIQSSLGSFFNSFNPAHKGPTLPRTLPVSLAVAS